MLLKKDIVIAAKALNPQSFGEGWLIAKGVVPAGSLIGNRFTAEEATHFATESAQTLVLRDKIIVTLTDKSVPADASQFVKRLIGAIADPGFIAIGVNTSSEAIVPDTVSVRTMFRSTFPYPKDIDTDEAVFGQSIAVKHTMGCILNMSITPVVWAQSPQKVVIDSNYHFEVPSGHNALEFLCGVCEQYQEIMDHAESVVRSLGQG